MTRVPSNHPHTTTQAMVPVRYHPACVGVLAYTPGQPPLSPCTCREPHCHPRLCQLSLRFLGVDLGQPLLVLVEMCVFFSEQLPTTTPTPDGDPEPGPRRTDEKGDQGASGAHPVTQGRAVQRQKAAAGSSTGTVL